jgi:hypothetical protein
MVCAPGFGLEDVEIPCLGNRWPRLGVKRRSEQCIKRARIDFDLVGKTRTALDYPARSGPAPLSARG